LDVGRLLGFLAETEVDAWTSATYVKKERHPTLSSSSPTTPVSASSSCGNPYLF
jgi:hypothetical protein